MPIADHPSTIPIDEVARQRERRNTRLLANPLVEDPELTLRDVVDLVRAARDELPNPVDIDQFLAAGGHGWRTIEAVKTYLDNTDPREG
jgi:hypothetical protein